MDFYVCLERPGYRVARRRKQLARVGVQHRVTKEDAMKWCVYLCAAAAGCYVLLLLPVCCCCWSGAVPQKCRREGGSWRGASGWVGGRGGRSAGVWPRRRSCAPPLNGCACVVRSTFREAACCCCYCSPLLYAALLLQVPNQV